MLQLPDVKLQESRPRLPTVFENPNLPKPLRESYTNEQPNPQEQGQLKPTSGGRRKLSTRKHKNTKHHRQNKNGKHSKHHSKKQNN